MSLLPPATFRARRGILGVAALLAATLAPSAAAGAQETVLGIPCTTATDGVRTCAGDLQHRVATWDGVPLDVTLTLPPATAKAKAPYPLIVGLHGFAGSKDSSPADPGYARDGYAVLSYSARGFGMSCGQVVSRGSADCLKGWSHLADVRYEPRDTQYLAGLLADAGLIDGQRIGVTGTSFGAGQALMLATLKDRTVMPDYRLVPWRSPQGTPMAIAGAAPNWAWANLASMLVPNGRDLDYSTENDYATGAGIGTPKLSYVGLLFGAATASGFFAPPNSDFASDADAWVTNFALGDPYSDYDRRVIDEITAHHSPYTIEDLPGAGHEQPAPIFDNTAWTDDLLPPTEQLKYRNRVLARYPNAEYDLLLSDGAGHPRASLTGKGTPGLAPLQKEFFDRLLKGAAGRPLGIRTFTQGCGASPVSGPFDTSSWGAQHPGEVAFASTGRRSITQTADPVTGVLDDPIAAIGSSCITAPAADSPLAATYRLPAASGEGYTILGSPTVIATIKASAPSTQVDARLWDVAPAGSQAFITRVAYRPRLGDDGPQVFQLHPNGWHVAPGHVIKLELVGMDQPYVRQSNAPFTATITDLALRLPVRQHPGTGQVIAPLPFLDRNGAPLPSAKLAATAVITPPHAAPVACRSARRVTIHVRGLRRARVTANDRPARVRHARAVIDLRGRPSGRVVVRTTGRRADGRRVRRLQVFHPCRSGRRTAR